jgi:hypothetical protein
MVAAKYNSPRNSESYRSSTVSQDSYSISTHYEVPDRKFYTPKMVSPEFSQRTIGEYVLPLTGQYERPAESNAPSLQPISLEGLN